MKTIYLNFIIITSLLFFISCDPEADSISGCTDNLACNYNAEATEEDGSCMLPDGCTDETACNYNVDALCDDGSCAYEADALPNPIEITYVEDFVSGSVDSLLVSHIHLRNASCEDMTDLVVRKLFNNQNASAYFCFNGICFTSVTELSPNPMLLSPFEEDDYFKGYLSAEMPGTYQVTYRFYVENSDPIQLTNVTITYEVN
ncbi:MAG: hypothetical protein CMP56_01050 [Flavobacteriales bacterium]|jgi:hypothetical protein|nr:hypothetical protein [Flavobacteriales bacterium]